MLVHGSVFIPLRTPNPQSLQTPYVPQALSVRSLSMSPVLPQQVSRTPKCGVPCLTTKGVSYLFGAHRSKTQGQAHTLQLGSPPSPAPQTDFYHLRTFPGAEWGGHISLLIPWM